MFDPKKISEVIQQVLDDLPPGFHNLPNDLQQHFKSCLQSAFEKLDLVTREEFDAQCRVLQRTREKLEALEQKLIREE